MKNIKKKPAREAEPVALIVQVLEHLSVMDKKLDIIIERFSAVPSAAKASVPPVVPQAQQQGAGPKEPQKREKPAYPATCAECRKDCTVPFKPTGDRPVYCRECFSRRKSSGPVKSPVISLRPPVENGPVTAAPVVQAAPKPPQVVSKKKSVTIKKGAPKKKPAVSNAKKKPVVKKKR